MPSGSTPPPAARIRLLMGAAFSAGVKPRMESSLNEYLQQLEKASPGVIKEAGGVAAARDAVSYAFAYASIGTESDYQIDPTYKQLIGVSERVNVKLEPGENLESWCLRVARQRPWLSNLMAEMVVGAEGNQAFKDFQQKLRGAIILMWLGLAAVLGAPALSALLQGITGAIFMVLTAGLGLLWFLAGKAQVDRCARATTLRYFWRMPLLPPRWKPVGVPAPLAELLESRRSMPQHRGESVGNQKQDS